ncbi:uncharacterized protein [Argopecten irradians]|uniref:uncharacterized protein n=1 Tax=Argopecten irradians TaxID=31199 RepID=UPI00371AE60B
MTSGLVNKITAEIYNLRGNMNAKLVLFLGLACVLLASEVTAYYCHWCNEDLRICKRSCHNGRGRNSRNKHAKCQLPCYQEAVYCLNMCDTQFPFAMSQLDRDDRFGSTLQAKESKRVG